MAVRLMIAVLANREGWNDRAQRAPGHITERGWQVHVHVCRARKTTLQNLTDLRSKILVLVCSHSKSTHVHVCTEVCRFSLVPRLHSPAFYRTVYKQCDKKLGSGVWERGYAGWLSTGEGKWAVALKSLIRLGCLVQRLTVYTVATVNSICLLH